jgi:ABC-type Fe3+ transport system substrate-binding protein
LLDPKWRGKIGVSTATHHWARLAQQWGDERTTRYVEALAAQQPVLGQPAEMNSRLLVGEVQIIASQVSSQVHEAKRMGAPIEFVDTARPVIVTPYSAGVIKGAAHPNIARLLAAFLMTPEAQTIWAASQGETSLHIEGSPAAQYVQGKEIVALDERYAADQLDPLTQKYGRLIGYR